MAAFRFEFRPNGLVHMEQPSQVKYVHSFDATLPEGTKVCISMPSLVSMASLGDASAEIFPVRVMRARTPWDDEPIEKKDKQAGEKHNFALL